jgi:hypothetical protein
MWLNKMGLGVEFAKDRLKVFRVSPDKTDQGGFNLRGIVGSKVAHAVLRPFKSPPQ